MEPHVWEEGERPFLLLTSMVLAPLAPNRRCFSNLVLGPGSALTAAHNLS